MNFDQEYKFSILYPTRNRPQLLKLCLHSVANFNYPNFEIIISDNSENKSAEPIYNLFKDDSRFKYYWTGGKFSMLENYNFAINQISSDYTIAMTDKSFLHPNSLQIINKILKAGYDFISWSDSGFKFDDEHYDSLTGYTYDRPISNTLDIYNSKQFLEEILQFKVHRKYHHADIWKGKILFGAAKSELINKCKINNQFFQNYAPDYTTRVSLLLMANTTAHSSIPLQCTLNSSLSNGDLCAFYPVHAYSFFNSGDNLKDVKNFPIPGLYVSQQNHVAGDMIKMVKLFKKDISINYLNLHKTILEDMVFIRFSSITEAWFHYKILFRFFWINYRSKFILYLFIIFLKYIKRIPKLIKHKMATTLGAYFPNLVEKLRIKFEKNATSKIYFQDAIAASKYVDSKNLIAFNDSKSK